MIRPFPSRAPVQPALKRLAALAPIDGPATAALEAAMGQPQLLRARYELMTEGAEIVGPKLVVSGWAARARLLADGRRQFLSFLLPGDLIGMCRHPRPLAVSTVAALTDVLVCAAPSAEQLPELADAYAISQALEEAYLLAQINRLGRLTAQERIADLLLELNERLSLAGLARDGSFDLPLTQEMLADALGLTSVHVNRMVQLSRREGVIVWKSGRLTIAHPEALAHSIGRLATRVCGEPAPAAAAARS